MKDFPKKTSSDLRKQHNAELLRRMRNGESLTSFDSRASWFPPRPIIQKDPREVARLYENATETKPATAAVQKGLKVVTLDQPQARGPKAPLGEAS